MRSIRVVAAEIRNAAGLYLIAQRMPHAGMPLLWEFPGGKVEPGEADEAALVREIEEELGVQITIVGRSLSVARDYGPYHIDFHSFEATIAQGQLQRLGVHDFRWVSSAEFADYRFPPVDQDAIARLLAG